MQFRSTWYDGKSSKGKPVVVSFEAHMPYFTVRSENGTIRIDRSEADILDPIGRKTGLLVFEKTQQIEIPDRQTYRMLKQMLGQNGFWSWVDNLENSWPLVVVSIGVVVFFVFGFIRWGLPAAAESIAQKIPQEVADTIGERGLVQLESQFFSETELDEDFQAEIRDKFFELVNGNDLDASKYTLHFYHSAQMGANAFALPSGDVVLLDGMIEIELTQDEILAVLAHEIAHVEKKHGLQMLLRYAGISTLVAVGFGDVNSSASLLVMIPKLLVEKGYSRTFETEADVVGAAYLTRVGRSPIALATGLEKLGAESSADFIPTMISSHPDIMERSEKIRALSPGPEDSGTEQ